MRNIIAAAVTLACAANLFADDILKFKDGKMPDMQGEIVNLNARNVSIEIDVGGNRAKQDQDSRNIADIVIDTQRKTFEYATGESAMNNGDFDAAIERFERVRKDPRAPEVLKQTASINIVRCYWNRDNLQGVLASVASLRAQRADSFYLRESYELEIKALLAMRNLQGAQQAIAAFAAKGGELGMPGWAKAAELMNASLLEMKGQIREALSLYAKHTRDPEVGEDAALGELRCLAAPSAPNYAQLLSRSEAIINESRTKKHVNPKLLMGAYNGRGEVLLTKDNKPKEALLDFMQGALVLARGETSREHETSLGRGAVACARVAVAEKDPNKKQTYKFRAQELLSELDKTYPGSPLKAEAVKTIAEVK